MQLGTGVNKNISVRGEPLLKKGGSKVIRKKGHPLPVLRGGVQDGS